MLMRVKDIADRLNVSSSCVYQLIESGRLAHHRIGAGRGSIRVSETDLQAFLQGCHQRVNEQAATAQRPARIKLKLIRL